MISETAKLKLEDKIELLANEHCASISDKKSLRDLVVINVYNYYGELYSDFKDKYGLEVVRVVDTCLANFEPAKGKFVYYLKSSMKHMLKFDPESALRYKRVRGEDADSSDSDENPGTNKTHLELIELPFSAYLITDEDGNESSFLDTLADNGRSFTEIANSEKDVRGILRLMDREYLMQQKRQQNYLKIGLTSIVFDAFGGDCFKYGIEDYKFFSNEINNLCKRLGRPLKDKEIAKLTGMTEGNYSRAMKAFREKLLRNAEFVELAA